MLSHTSPLKRRTSASTSLQEAQLLDVDIPHGQQNIASDKQTDLLQDIQVEDEETDSEPARHLFVTLLATFSMLLRILATNPDHLDVENYASLRNEFLKFFTWNEGFSTRTGGLDRVLSYSKNLKGTVLELIVQWVKTVARVPKVLSDIDWTGAIPDLDDLQSLNLRVDRIAKATVSDLKSQYSNIERNNFEDDQDSNSEAESWTSDYVFRDIIEDLSAFMESLSALSHSLDHPAKDYVHLAQASTRPFVLAIINLFPSLDYGIARKLGEANWQRQNRIRLKLESTPGMSKASVSGEDVSGAKTSSIEYPNRVIEKGQTEVEAVRSNIGLRRSQFFSSAKSSQSSKPSIFRRKPKTATSTQVKENADSTASSFVSIASDDRSSRPRIPSLPKGHEYGSAFRCPICSDILVTIQHQDWEDHVYRDLQPYSCLFVDCNLGPHTFCSQQEWMDHELQVHRVCAEWRCNLCQTSFESPELFQEHVRNVHSEDMNMTQIGEFTSGSKRLVPCKIENEACPFCLTTHTFAQRQFMNHVGEHQREISLLALSGPVGSLDDVAVARPSVSAPLASNSSSETSATLNQARISRKETTMSKDSAQTTSQGQTNSINRGVLSRVFKAKTGIRVGVSRSGRSMESNLSTATISSFTFSSSRSTASTGLWVISLAPGDQPKSYRQGSKVSPFAVRELCELIRLRYSLDSEIWAQRQCHLRDRNILEEKMRRSDAALSMIRAIVDFWDRREVWEYEDDWRKLQDIKHRLGMGGKRLWAQNPPWGK